MRTSLLILFLFRALGSLAVAASSLRPVDLRCEYLRDPLGIDSAGPGLGWMCQAVDPQARGLNQTAYQVLVASRPEELSAVRADLWDSGKIESDNSVQVIYSGKPLLSTQECFWTVRVWDQAGRPSPWSTPARWSMGLLKPADWRGQWIGFDEEERPSGTNAPPEVRRLPARWLRRDFQVIKPLRRGTVWFSGLGLSELYLNGRKVGRDVLSPGLTDYTRRVLYVTHDVKPFLKKGANAVGVVLGNGRFYAPRSRVPTETVSYGYPKMLFQMRLEYVDGTTQEIVSDASWRLTTDGPIRANNEYDGEEYDARLEMKRWAEPGCDDSKWRPAQLVHEPGGVLAPQMIEPIRVIETLKPVALKEPKPGVFLFDMGQNMVGWCRLKVSGPRGTAVFLRHAEVLKPDGTLYLDNIRSARVTDIYTLKGEGTEYYEPRFTYHGFRYVEVTGFPGRPSLSAIEGKVVHDNLESAGAFTCSNPLLNRIYTNILWGVRGNYRSLPTDCPQRDERQGWLGDRSAESKGETYLFNTAALYRKWLQDMADAQKPNGSVPDVCPAYWPIYSDNVTWPSSTVIIPAALREQFGDEAIIRTHYESAKKWLDYMAAFVTNGVISRDSYGDWCVPPEEQKLIHSKDPLRKTAPALLATAYYYYDLRLMERYATLLNQPADAQRFQSLAADVKTAFNRKFWNNQASYYDNGSQTSCVLPLALGLVPEEDRQPLFAHLVEKISTETRGHVGTGLVGGQWLMRVLTDHGRADLAYQMASQKSYPSWGYMIQKGATTIWELWNGDTADPAMNSGNHVMLVGDLGIWFFERLAGIASDPEQPGFKRVLMRPEIPGALHLVQATHHSPYGLIVSSWKKEKDAFRWRVEIPPNSTARIFLPALKTESIRESGKLLSESKAVRLLKWEAGRAELLIGSGRYAFESSAPTDR